jgi:tetratricopeptide (TPR) repeat protein
MNEEVAAYISNYQDLLFFFFGMLALIFSTRGKSKFADLKVFILLSLSLLSKETGIIFCFINLAYVSIFNRERLKTTVIYTVLLITSYAFVRTNAVGFKAPHDFRIGRVSLSARLINIPKMTFFYLYTFVFPINLAVSYDWIVSRFSFLDFFLPISMLIVFFSGVLFAGKKLIEKNTHQFKLFLFFTLWFLLGLSIHLQIIPLDGTVAVRWFYLSMVGILGMIGIVIQQFITKKNAKTILLIVAVIIIGIFSLRTIIRNSDFKDNLTLMCHDANVSHDNFSLENSCGVSLLAVGSLDAAQIHLERSVALAPYFGTNYWGLGAVLGRKAEIYKNKNLYDRSVIAFKTAITIEPSIPWSYESLGYLYSRYADTETARTFLKSSLKKFPNDYTLWLHFAYEEYKAGDSKTALQAITNAYILNPHDSLVVEYYYNLSNNLPIKIEKGIF